MTNNAVRHQTKLKGGLQWLHSADNVAVQWLTAHGLQVYTATTTTTRTTTVSNTQTDRQTNRQTDRVTVSVKWTERVLDQER